MTTPLLVAAAAALVSTVVFLVMRADHTGAIIPLARRRRVTLLAIVLPVVAFTLAIVTKA